MKKLNLNSILANCFPLCIGYKAGNKFLDIYATKYSEITEDKEGFQKLSSLATRAKQLYLHEIASQKGYNYVQNLIFKLGFHLGSD